LRERREDIPLLAGHFLERFGKKNRKSIKGYTPKAMDAMIRYDWPGNVRELMNAVERGVILARSDYLDREDVSVIQASSQADAAPQPFAGDISGDMPLEEVEKAAILKTLDSAEGNKSEAARRLGITRRTLHQKLKKYGVMP
jgi:two-component system response regulator HydG